MLQLFRNLTCVLFSLCICAGAAFAGSYSFDEALERLYKVDDSVQAAAKDVESSKARKRAASGMRLPSISVKGAYTFLDAPIYMDLNPIRDAIQPLYDNAGLGVTLPSFKETVQEDKFFKAEAAASMPLFTGGRINSANTSAQASVDESGARFETLRNNMLYELSVKYYGALVADMVARVRREYMESAREHASDSAKMLSAGTIAKVEKMSADLSYSEAQTDYNLSLNDAELAANLLRNMLYEDIRITLSSDLFVCDEKDIESLDYFQKLAQAHSAQLKIYDARIKMAQSQIKMQSSALLPDIYVFGSRELYDRDLTSTDPEYAYGVGFEWNLFNGLSDANKRKAAKFRKESADFARRNEAKNIENQVEFFHKKMLNSIYKYKTMQDNIALSKEFLKARTLAFETGTGTSLEVNTARAQLLRSQLESINASYEFVTSLAGMLSLCGDTKDFDSYRKKAKK